MEISKKILEGTFIQPNLILDWESEQFDRHFKEYRTIGFDHIILQWIEYKNLSANIRYTYYPGTLQGRKLEKDLLTNLLKYGLKNNVKIYIGLNINDEWWKAIGKSPKEFNEWWNNEAAESLKLVNDIWSKYKHYAKSYGFNTLAGWYMAFEVDNFHFNTIEKQNILAKQYNTVVNYIHKMTGLPVMISPYFNRALGLIYGPKKWRSMWENILSQTNIDIIALQDGIGCDREVMCEDTNREKAIKNVGKWFKAIRDAIRKSKKKIELWSDLETFVEERVDGKSRFSSASMDRIIRQIEAEAPFVDKFTSFSFQAYQDYDKAPGLYEEYKNYVDDVICR